MATTAILTAALLLSGHPEVAAIGGLFAALCGIGLHRRRRFLSGLGAATAAALLGFALAAPLLLPFLAAVPGSQRAHETLGGMPPPGPLELARPRTWFYYPQSWEFFLAPTNPRAFGRPYVDPFDGPHNWAEAESAYSGLVVFAAAVLALLAAWRDRRDRRGWPFLAFAGLALLLAARFLPLQALLFQVPPLRALSYERFPIIGSLALAIAAAFGMDLLGSTRRGRGPLVFAAGLGLALAVSLRVHADARVVALWGLILAAAFAARAGRRWRPLAASLLGLALLADLVPWGRSLLPPGDPALFYPRTPFVAEIVLDANADGGPWRAVGAESLTYPSILPYYGAAEVRPHNPLAPMAYLEVLAAAFDFRPTRSDYTSGFHHVDHPLLDFLNVRVVVGSIAMPPSRRLVAIDGGRYAGIFCNIYKNPGALPRWFVPTGVEVIERDGVRTFIQRMQDPARVAVFADEVGSWRPADLPKRATGLTVRTAVPGRVELELPAAAGAEGTLVATSIPKASGWTATAGGRPVPTLTVNGAFLGVRLPPGATEVELRYRPPGLLVGVGLALLAWVGVVGLLWGGRKAGSGGASPCRRPRPILALRGKRNESPQPISQTGSMRPSRERPW